LGVLQNERLEEGISGNNNSGNNSRTAGRQVRMAEFGKEVMSWLRQKVELGFGFDLNSPA
jgi:hypothetical protein